MNFGENLYNMRKKEKMSQEALAEKVGVSRQSVSKWENGDAYPEMNRILELCKIFGCNFTDLVNDELTDLDSLDEDVKMGVVKFKEKEQKRVKGLSKAISVIAKIGEIVSKVALVCGVLVAVFCTIVMANVKFNSELSTITAFGEEKAYELTDNSLIIDGSNFATDITPQEMVSISEFIEHGVFYRASLIFMAGLSLTLMGLFLSLTMKNASKLFKNISENETPFTMENVEHIRKAAIFLGLSTLTPDVLGSLASLIFKLELGVEINIMSYVVVLMLLAVAYVFKYGYELQRDTDSKMYGLTEEK